MNDFLEVEYGTRCLANVWNNAVGIHLRSLLDEIFPGSAKRIQTNFNSRLQDYKTETYMACISEHLSSEDENGRLSMWRAYGGQTGVALVMHQTPFLAPSSALEIYTSAVAYLTVEEFEGEFAQISNNLYRDRAYLAEQGEDRVVQFMDQAMRYAVLCTKHPGFKEELEWRIIYSPTERPSTRLVSEIVDVMGVPQRIYRVPLTNVPELGLSGVEPARLIDRVIIGPNRYPRVVAQAFISLLEEAGIPDAATRVFVSDIPLRR